MKIIAVEGIIGVGKTTLLKHLEKMANNYFYIYEPISAFEHFGKHEPLALLYNNPTENGGLVQAYIDKVFFQHWKTKLESIPPQGIVISERTLYSSIIFTHNLYKLGFLNRFAFDFLRNEIENHIALLGLPELGADKVFFLDLPVKTCMERIAIRSREAETSCDCAYLYGLQDCMRTYIDKFKHTNGKQNLFTSQSPLDLDTLTRNLCQFINA